MGKRRIAEIAGISLGLSLAHDVGAAGRRSQETTLTRIEILLEDAKNRTDALDLEYRNRGGLLGGEEAKERYEEGVYLFWLGSYEPAAMNFYALVESKALGHAGKHQDAEWYLAESLYELQNYRIANDFYTAISDQGPSHLFFEDAVRKQLDIHAVLGDQDSFKNVYDRYIKTLRVEQTDSLAYTLGKSFYRRGDIQQAKLAFMQIGIQPGERDQGVCVRAAAVSSLENEYLGKACYFMGVMNSLESQGDLEAASNAFSVVAGIADQDPRITEQAILALARIAKEQGDYTAATSYYQQVPNDSDLLDVKLYELIYTFIDQGQWSEALRDVDIFLTAFPDHRKAAQLRLLKGHLHMKKADSSDLAHKAPEQERAHNAYWELRERSSPVR
jgi:TolA-binding protein